MLKSPERGWGWLSQPWWQILISPPSSLPVTFPGSDRKAKRGAQKLRPSDCCFLPMRPIMILPQLRRREYLKSMPQRENFSPGDLLETTIYVVLEFPWRGKESKHYYLLIITPCYIWETLESEMSRDVPKSTQVVHGEDRIQRPVSLSPLLTTSTVQWSF